MNIILLSGGSGTRLWPISSDRRSKQFLQLFKDEDGNPESMLQHVWKQLQRRGLAGSTVIATSSEQLPMIREQLGDEPDLVLETERRDTFPAILLSVAYLYTHRKIGRDEMVAVMPVDVQVQDCFYDTLLQLPQALEQSGAALALMGTRPTEPSERFGYMIPDGGDSSASFYSIREFCEKPGAIDAARYIEQGAFWNCGVFCFRAGYMLDLLKRMGLTETYEELLQVYYQLECRSFDYAVVEKEPNLVAVPYEGRWKDVGTWAALSEEVSEPVIGPGFIGNECGNVHIINEMDTPVVVLGVSDIVVAASKEGILVTHKKESFRLKEALSCLNKELLTEGSAGDAQSDIVDRSVFADGTSVTTSRVRLDEGTQRVYKRSTGRGRQTVSWTILHGCARLIKNSEERVIAVGSTILIERDENAILWAVEPLDFIEIITDYND